VVDRRNDTRESSAAHVKFPPRMLLIVLLVSLPLLNPWVRGDGVGYYAFARALLIQHNLDFAPDYKNANEGFREARLDPAGVPKQEDEKAQRTPLVDCRADLSWDNH